MEEVTGEAAGGTPAGSEAEGEIARATLARILELMGLQATVTVHPQDDESYRLEVQAEESGILIGNQGATINALQYLVGLMTHHRVGHRVRVVVNAAGYREQREETLRKLALDFAQQVKETGQEAVLDALQSYERRIIHTALAEDPDVMTYSEGEEPDRRVVISPRETEE
jgi:spoIIIJ-associated protein